MLGCILVWSRPDGTRRWEAEVADLSDQEDLSARRITDEVKERVLSWAKWIVGGVALIAALVGVRAYSDYQGALNKINEDLNKRVEAEVQQEVAKAVASYEKFTAKMIDTIVEAEGRQRDLKRSVDGIQKQVAGAEVDLQRFRKRLNELEQQAEGDYKTYSAQLTLTVSRSGTTADSKDLERQFMRNVEDFARQIGLPFNTKMVFKKQKEKMVQAWYNEKTEEYEVNPEHIQAPGLAKYAAVMGHFLAKNFKKCSQLAGHDIMYWQDFRYSVASYVIEDESVIGLTDKVLKSLKAIESKTGSRDQVRKLAVRLLESYQCDWNHRNSHTNIMKTNADQQLIAPDLVKAALDSVT
jgi:hypothetical protein